MRKQWYARFVVILFCQVGSNLLRAQPTLADSIEQAIVKPYVDHISVKKEVFYIQANKELFVPGEPLAFKVYILAAHNYMPFLETKNVYVDLFNANGQLIDKQILYAEGGSASGSFVLSSTLKPGSYLLRAYTSWSQNFTRELYGNFQFYIIGSSKEQAYSTNSQSDWKLEFYPEGGSLISSIENKVGLRLYDSLGLGKETRLQIKRGDQILQTVYTNKRGFGSFSVVPHMAERMTIEWVQPSGETHFENLPNALEKGVHLSVLNPLDDSLLTVEIRTNIETLRSLSAQKFYLLIHHQGIVSKIHWISFISRRTNVIQQFLKKELPVGITHITLFDSSFQPIGDRAFYNEPSVQTFSYPTILYGKDSLHVNVLLETKTKQPIEANLSVSFLPLETEADNFSSSILSRYFLEQDIVGFVEKPIYYFEERDSIRRHHLDDLLIVRGWRTYNWNKILNDKQNRLEFPFEEGFSIRGNLSDYHQSSNKNIQQLILSSPSQQLFLKTTIDSAGWFEYKYLFLLRGNLISLFTTSGADKKRYKNLVVQPQRLFFDTTSKMHFLPFKPRNGFQVEADSIRIGGKLMETVIVKKQISDRTIPPIHPLLSAIDKVHVLNDNDRTQYKTLKEYLLMNHHIRTFEKEDKETGVMVYHVSFNMSSSFQLTTDPVLIIDGMLISDLRYIEFLPLWDVEAIAIEKNGSAVAAFGAGGTIVVKSKTAGSDDGVAKATPTNALAQFMLEGYTFPSEYYLPEYGVSTSSKVFKKVACLYWKPDIATDSFGRVNFSVPMPVIPASGVRMIIEGVGKNGELIHLKKDVIYSKPN